jgi:hypothetical protein
VVWIAQDSGHDPVVHGVGPDGDTVSTLRLAGAENVDWEAMAPGVGADGAPTLLVADIGDNGADRPFISVYEVAEPTESGDRELPARRFDFTYPDRPHDAEAFLVDPRTQDWFVVIKSVKGGRIFQVVDKSEEQPTTLREVGMGPAVATDGAFAPDGDGLLVRTYTHAFYLPAPDLESVDQLLLPLQPQGETLAWPEGVDHFLVGSEGAGSEVLAVPLPAEWGSRDTEGASSGAVTDTGAGSESALPGTAVVALVAVALVAGVAVVAISRAGRRRSRSTP